MVEHWDDVLSDFSAIHRIGEDEIERLTARQFWPKALRLVHYQGACRDIATAQFHKSSGAGAQQIPSTNVPSGQTELVDPTQDQINAMRAAARRKRFPAEKFGEVKHVSAEQVVREAGRG